MNSQPGGSTFAARAALLGLGAAAILSLTACNAPGLAPTAALPATTASTPAAEPSPAATRLTTAPTATVSVAPKPRASTSAASVRPVTHHYRDARTQWLKGATASSAEEGNYWLAAAADLKAADVAGYAAAITELQQLTALPDAEQTPAQNAEFHHDVNALNTFFGTPGQYS